MAEQACSRAMLTLRLFCDIFCNIFQLDSPAFVIRKLISLRLHCAAPVVSRTPIANEDHLLGKHEHDQLLQNQFHTSVASTTNGEGAAYFVLQRETALSKGEHSLEELL